MRVPARKHCAGKRKASVCLACAKREGAGLHAAAFLHCGDEVVEGADAVDYLLHDSRVGAEHSPWPAPSRTLAIGMPRTCRSATFDGSLPSVI